MAHKAITPRNALIACGATALAIIGITQLNAHNATTQADRAASQQRHAYTNELRQADMAREAAGITSPRPTLTGYTEWDLGTGYCNGATAIADKKAGRDYTPVNDRDADAYVFVYSNRGDISAAAKKTLCPTAE